LPGRLAAGGQPEAADHSWACKPGPITVRARQAR
jgi:hypothetical protein